MRNYLMILVSVLGLGLGLAGQGALAAGTITQSPRGAVIETERYRAAIANGVLVSFVNKLTQEEYLNQSAKPEELVTHLPSGLGTQHEAAECAAARQLFAWPWWEQPVTSVWPNQHIPDAQSALVFAAKDAQNAVLTYTGLSSGAERFADETFALEVGIDPQTGDLLVTPAVASPRGGVYGCGFTVSALAPEVTVEAPIFEGVRLDRKMQPNLWVNAWANFWDYAFLALNGEKTGAVGVWCQDAELKLYKTLFYLVNEQGLSFSVLAMNIPPFEGLTSAKPITWRLQAFDKSWAQAAARYRDWRLKNVKIAPRPDWVLKLSFMEFGGNLAGPGNMVAAEKFFEGKDLDQVITWAPAVRAAGFDKNHANNTPYAGFREDMKTWKAKQRKLMVYLQPMIMWGPDPKTDRERQAVEFSREANTRSPFRADHDTVDLTHDQHNLGSPRWQRWFLDWVKEYIQDDGADGIYHDQSYACPLDVRGAAAPGGMTSTQGMADYFYKAVTENPNTIHGTEHMTEVNNVGASLGLGCGIIWGTPGYQGKIGPSGSMNWQRIKKASPVSNALHYPNGAIFGFPHQSNYPERGAVAFHHGMDQMERRGDLAAIATGTYWAFLQVPFEFWANEIWLDRQRALAFVRHGLRAVFPEDWDRKVLSYFKGANGEDFRYEQMPWGTAFVQYKGGARRLEYARINGVTRAAVEGGTILGWPCYDASGPAGLNPAGIVTYCVDSTCQRPPAWFSLPAEDLYVADGYANADLAFMQLQPIPGRPTTTTTVFLNAPTAPTAVWVDGKAVPATPAGDKRWQIAAGAGATVYALFREPPAGFAPVATDLALSRVVDTATRRDILRPAGFQGRVTQDKAGVKITPAGQGLNLPFAASEVHIPLKAPVAGGAGILRIVTAAAPAGCRLNGKAVAFAPQDAASQPKVQALDIPLQAGEVALLSLNVAAAGTFAFDWKPGAAP